MVPHDSDRTALSSTDAAIVRALGGSLEGGVPCCVDAMQLLVVQGWHALKQGSTGLSHRVTICRDTLAPHPGHRFTPLEFRSSYLAGHGFTAKQIASALSVTEAATRGALGRALQKLGLRCSTQLPSFWLSLSATGMRFEPRSGLELLLFECALDPLDGAVRLTTVERAVLRLIVDGESNRGIAERRGTSVRTVANQVAAMYRKFGASSRTELAARALRLVPNENAIVDEPPMQPRC